MTKGKKTENIKISVVIPTLNEEKDLPILLESLKQQTFKDFEVLVGDGGSTDRTKDIARRYGARVVKGGSPAKGRNGGARAARGDFIFFLDADVKVPKTFLKKAYKEMQDRYIDLATCEFRPSSKLYIDKVMHEIANTFIKLSQFSRPHAPGFCIFVTQRLFERVGGFDESLKLAEDHDFVERASKFRPMKWLEKPHIMVSVRRMEKEGRLELLSKYLHSEAHMFFKGKIKEDVIEYEFGDFENKDRKTKLQRLEKQIVVLNRKYKKMVRGVKKKGLIPREELGRLKAELDNQIDKFKKIVLK